MSTEAGTTARWWVARSVARLSSIGRGPQRPVEHLADLRHARECLDAATSFMVDAARAEGASWADIGSALGISRQAALQASVRRGELDDLREVAKTWHAPLPDRRPRLRWLRRRAS